MEEPSTSNTGPVLHLNTGNDLELTTDKHTETPNASVKPAEPPASSRAFPCDHCDKRYDTKLKLRRHMIVHLHSHPCGECGKSFPTKDKLNRHTLIHSDERKFRCDHCNMQFRRIDYLADHIRREVCKRTVGGVPLQKCSKCVPCKLYFPNTSQVERHMKAVHKDARQYKCTECSHYFLKPSAMQAHTQVHSDVRGFSCEVCDKSYKRRDSLNYHQRRFNHYIKLVFEEKGEEEEEEEEGEEEEGEGEEQEEEGEEEEELKLPERVDRGRRRSRNSTGKGMLEERAEGGEGSLRDDQRQEEVDGILDSENLREEEDEVE